MSQDLLVIVKSSYCSDEILDSLMNIVNKAINTVKESDNKLLLEKSLKQIKKIQQMEENEKISDEDLDTLLDAIE
jgi:mevalonate kinase